MSGYHFASVKESSMQTIYTVWDRADRALQRWLIRHSIRFLRIALGAVFLGFGVL